MSRKSPSWHVVVNGEPHAVVTKSESGTYWVKDVPETTMATSGAHWVSDSQGSSLHFDLYRDKNKWHAVALDNARVERVPVGPEARTFSISGFSDYSVVPIDPAIHSIEHAGSSGAVTIRADVHGQIILAAYEPPSSDLRWQARTRSSGP